MKNEVKSEVKNETSKPVAHPKPIKVKSQVPGSEFILDGHNHNQSLVRG
jgi:hypothetical protein